jgi:hypothetical protein
MAFFTPDAQNENRWWFAGLRIKVTLGTGRGWRRGRLYPILRVFVWT